MKAFISALYWVVIIIFLIIYGVFISIAWALTVPFDPQRRILAYTTHIHAMAFFRLAPGWKVKIEGRENLKKNTPYVIVTNHQAMFDIPLLHALAFNVRWVAKRELIKMPFVGHAMLIHGDILIDRGNPNSAKEMMQRSLRELKRGVSISIFPEGTRSKTSRVGNFKDGAFLMAKEAGVGILPIVADGTANTFVGGWKLRMPHTFTIKVLPAITPEEVAETGVRQMKTRVHDTILENHKALRPDLYRE